MGAYLGNNKKLKLMVNNVAFKIYSGKIVNCVHEYSTEVITPTCTTQGYTKHSCSLCGNIYNSDYVAKLEHTIEIIPGKEATTTTPGLTEGQKCKVCGKILKEQTEIPAIHVHTSAYRNENRIEATCMTNGSYDHVEYCTSCFAVLNRTNKTISATGHSWGDWITDVEATESSAGSKHRVCNNCSERETGTIPQLTHTHSAGTAQRENEIAATCTAEGRYDLVIRCTGCNEVMSSESKATSALGHSWSDWVIDSTATETTAGSSHRECSVCNSRETATIPATGHITHTPGTATRENEVAATCEVAGSYDMVVRCTNVTCKEILSSTSHSIPAKGHTEGNAVTENSTSATCTTSGRYDTVKYCTVCNKELSRLTTEIPANGHIDVAPKDYICDVCHADLCTTETHTLVTIPAVAATCTKTGLSEGKKCSKCGEITVAQQVIDAKGHTEVIDAAKAATCTESGLSEGKHCSVCNTVLVAQTIVPAKDHSYQVTTPAKAVTCTTDGATAAQECSVCHDKIASVVIPKTGHDWETGDPICLCGNGCGEHRPEWGEDGKCIQCGKDCWHDEN